jgi:hypothetical protein
MRGGSSATVVTRLERASLHGRFIFEHDRPKTSALRNTAWPRSSTERRDRAITGNPARGSWRHCARSPSRYRRPEVALNSLSGGEEVIVCHPSLPLPTGCYPLGRQPKGSGTEDTQDPRCSTRSSESELFSQFGLLVWPAMRHMCRSHGFAHVPRIRSQTRARLCSR